MRMDVEILIELKYGGFFSGRLSSDTFTNNDARKIKYALQADLFLFNNSIYTSTCMHKETHRISFKKISIPIKCLQRCASAKSFHN